MLYNAILCRYHEIATKGANRIMFERVLVENLNRLTATASGEYRAKRVRGRIWVERRDQAPFAPEEVEKLRPALEKAFGVETFSPCIFLPPEWEKVRTAALESGGEYLKNILSAGDGELRFRVRARRSNKKFPLRSQEMEIELVTALDDMLDHRLKVDLSNRAEVTLGCEIRDEFAVLFFETFRGPGGLPVGSNPGVLTMLSGGIDSPAAAWMIMKRGCRNDFITFHSAPYTPQETLDKVKRIHSVIDSWQSHGKLYACNLAPFQKMVRDLCNEKDRTVLYRRAMVRIAEKLARRIGDKALVTGDSVGQVASQTIVNMGTIDRAVEMLILRPLCGADKLESIAIAEKIGTMELSSVQVPDSCSVFAPDSPSTAVPPGVAASEEAKIPDYDKVLEKITDDIAIIA